MALTTDQLADLQADIGISDDETVFTDTELNRLFTRAGSDYAMTVAYALRQLMADKAKLADYSRGETRESRSQIFAHLQAMYDLWAAEAGGGLVPLAAGTIEQDLIEPYSTTEYT